MVCIYSYAFAFYAASQLTGSGLEKIHNVIDETIAQADEVDEKYLQVSHVIFLVCVNFDVSSS